MPQAADVDAEWRRCRPLELSPILTAAMDAFYDQGFHGASVRDIARRVGVTVPALYYHHENKEAILVSLLETAVEEVLQRATAAADDAGDDPALRLQYVVEAIALHMTRRTRLAALDAELRYLSPGNRKRYAAMRRQVQDLVTGIVRSGLAAGVFDVEDPDETSRALLGMCQAIPRWYRPDGPLGAGDVSARYVSIACRTAGVRPTSEVSS